MQFFINNSNFILEYETIANVDKTKKDFFSACSVAYVAVGLLDAYIFSSKCFHSLNLLNVNFYVFRLNYSS